MMGSLVVAAGLVVIIIAAWNLAQQNVLGKEPWAYPIGLSYGGVALGAVAWLAAPWLPFERLGVPLFVGSLAVNLGLISLRLYRLYERKP